MTQQRESRLAEQRKPPWMSALAWEQTKALREEGRLHIHEMTQGDIDEMLEDPEVRQLLDDIRKDEDGEASKA